MTLQRSWYGGRRYGDSRYGGWLLVRYLLAALVVVAALVGLTLPSLVSYAPYGQQAIDQQIDAEDSSLCAKFGLRPEMNQFHECKTDLADMRHRHEQLLLY